MYHLNIFGHISQNIVQHFSQYKPILIIILQADHIIE